MSKSMLRRREVPVSRTFADGLATEGEISTQRLARVSSRNNRCVSVTVLLNLFF